MNSPNPHAASSERSLVLQRIENLDEQRHYPRVPLNIKTAFITDTGSKFSATVSNISPDGLQIRCSGDGAKLIRPHGQNIERPFMSAAILLPVGNGTRTLAARCQVLYLRTVDTEPRCVAGLRFVELPQQSERILNAFFADQRSGPHILDTVLSEICAGFQAVFATFSKYTASGVRRSARGSTQLLK